MLSLTTLTCLASLLCISRAQLPASDDIPRLWPSPSSFTLGVTAYALTLDPDTFSIEYDVGDDVVSWNSAYYMKELFRRGGGLGGGTQELR